MRSPYNRYQYQLTDALGSTTISPLGESGLKVERTRNDENKLSYSDELAGTLTLTGADFTRLLTIEGSADRCDPLYIQIKRNCGGTWEDFGPLRRFFLTDAEWDLDRCTVQIKFDKYEAEDCLEKNKSKEIDLFTLIAGRYTALLIRPGTVIEKVTYTTTGGACNGETYWGGSGTPADGGWVPYYIYNGLTFSGGVVSCHNETRWARQKLVLPVATPQPSFEWILAGTSGGNNTWVRSAILYNKKETITPFQGSVIRAYTFESSIVGDGGGITDIDNGLRLGDCFQAFADTFCVGLTVKSQFFQINPDTVTTTNYVTGTTSKVRHLLVYQKSDVKRPTINNATKFLVSWEKFIGQFVEMFNVRWAVIGSVLRIEHVSWFPQNAGIDLTGPAYSKYVAGMQKYSYKSADVPGSEAFAFMEATPGSDFQGVPIVYDGGCVSSGKENVKNHAADFTTTDVEYCLLNSDSGSSLVEDKGMAVIACDDGLNIISEPPILDTVARTNNTLAWAQLHASYHKHYRYLISGLMNNVATTFLSVIPIKKGKPVTIPFCCGDTFDPNDTVTTVLGDGIVEKSTFNFKDDTLTIELLYPVD